MTNRPIIFSAPMVRALLGGRKTMTRRLAWQGNGPTVIVKDSEVRSESKGHRPSPWQKVAPGARLWVRETAFYGPDNEVIFAADDNDDVQDVADDAAGRVPWRSSWKQRPSIHMPRWASRLTLVVTTARIERLQDISEEDAIAEGIERATSAYMHAGWYDYEKERLEDGTPGWMTTDPRRSFGSLWRWLHGAESWASNPEVVAISFAVHKCNIDNLIPQEAR